MAKAKKSTKASRNVGRVNAASGDNMLNIRLADSLFEELKKRAQEQCLPVSTLVRCWLVQRLQQAAA